VVLGHTQCGAVTAAVKVVKEGGRLPGHLPELVRAIEPAVRIAGSHDGGDLVARATVENVRLNANRLLVARPLIERYVKSGRVKVVGAMYDLATGKVDMI
jgi:carbonic anhydrase